jgi:hypothetical protein
MSRVSGLRRLMHRRTIRLAGLGALFGLAGSGSSASAGPSATLTLGDSSSPWAGGVPTELSGDASPTLKIAATQVGRALEAWGGPGEDLLYGDGRGGAGIIVTGGTASGSNKELTSGSGTVAIGGSSDAGPGGPGVLLMGGTGSNGAHAGAGIGADGEVGIIARGGRAKTTGEPGPWGGEGIHAFGGIGQKFDGNVGFGAGIVAIGGDAAPFQSTPGGRGVIARGWVTVKDQARKLGVHAIGEKKGHGLFATAFDKASAAVAGWSKTTAAGARGEASVNIGVGIFGQNFGSGPGAYFTAKVGKAIKVLGTTAAIRAESTAGVAIYASAAIGKALVGRSTDGAGVFASSASRTGAYLETTSAMAAAITAKHTLATSLGAEDGLFVHGDCIVENGDKTVVASTSLGQTLLYVVEAAMSVFEDIGKARLQNGRIRVELDPLFAETIETGEYQVHLTARGDTKGVYVAARDAGGFEIREQAGGASNVEVNYRIVALRKGFGPDRRLATVPRPAPPARLEMRRPPGSQLRAIAAVRPDQTGLRSALPTRQGDG